MGIRPKNIDLSLGILKYRRKKGVEELAHIQTVDITHLDGRDNLISLYLNSCDNSISTNLNGRN